MRTPFRRLGTAVVVGALLGGALSYSRRQPAFYRHASRTSTPPAITNDFDPELWKSNGTEAGTTRVEDINLARRVASCGGPTARPAGRPGSRTSLPVRAARIRTRSSSSPASWSSAARHASTLSARKRCFGPTAQGPGRSRSATTPATRSLARSTGLPSSARACSSSLTRLRYQCRDAVR